MSETEYTLGKLARDYVYALVVLIALLVLAEWIWG